MFNCFVFKQSSLLNSVFPLFHYYSGGKIEGLALPTRVFPCATPKEVRSTLPAGEDVVAFQCRNPIHRAHYELFTRALDADNVGEGAVCLVHPTCGPTQVYKRIVMIFILTNEGCYDYESML